MALPLPVVILSIQRKQWNSDQGPTKNHLYHSQTMLANLITFLHQAEKTSNQTLQKPREGKERWGAGIGWGRSAGNCDTFNF